MSLKNHIRLLVLSFAMTLFSAGHSQGVKPGLTIKEYAKSAPFLISRSPQKLAKYLTRKDSSKAQQALNIYTWIIHNIDYDLKALKKVKSKTYDSKQTLRRRKGICYQYSNLFNTLCLNAGISAREIVGYSRGLSYFEDDIFYEADHSWNGVKIDSNWFLVDVTWGSGKAVQKRQRLKELWFRWFDKPYINDKYKFKRKPSIDFFLVPPEILISDHLPVDPTWQLIEYPISVQTFESPRWKGYPHCIDSSYSKVIDPTAYTRMLDEYEFLSYIQYLAKTATKANLYNPKNSRLLSESSLRNASSRHGNYGDPESRIKHNNEAIGYYKSAIAYARTHKKTIIAESNQMARTSQNRINHELHTPSKRRLKPTNYQLSRSRKILLRREKVIENYNTKIARLQHVVKYKNYKALDLDRFSKRPRPELVEKNNAKLSKGDMVIKQSQDTVKVLLQKLKALIREKPGFHSKLIDQNNVLSLMIGENSALIIDNWKFHEISHSMSQIDSQGSNIDSLNSELRNIEDSIILLSRSIQQFHSSLIAQTQLNQKMLYQNCTFSKGEACNDSAYVNCNKAQKEAYREKLEIQKLLFESKKDDYLYYGEIVEILASQFNLLSTHAKLISFYKTRRADRIRFKKEKGIYDMELIANNSLQVIRSLTSINRKLSIELMK